MADEVGKPGAGLVDQLEKLLSISQVAKLKQFQSLLSKVRDGEALRPAEIKLLQTLERQFETQIAEQKAGAGRLSATEAMKRGGWSKRQYYIRIKKGKLIPASDGTVAVADVDRLVEAEGRVPVNGAESGQESREKVEIELRKMRVERERMLVAQMAGTLISREEVYREWAARVREVRGGLLNFAQRLAPVLEYKGRAEIARIISEEVWSLLDRYARSGKHTPPVGPAGAGAVGPEDPVGRVGN
ncbi:MAG: hypothetical protein A4E73_02443 [Syntrophaceae bacterium PtaU1.Bin231]|nr:MAG: hypothetical protein A4E73_02443 [Syntrophaceae bacterium PtaU1.Bin231]